jgi:hypothetical protein
VITGIEIERLRGIREGKLDDLTALTVLVGPSGSGKSTVLDALLIAASDSPADAIGRVVLRRAELPAGAPWLFERGAPDAAIKLHGDKKLERACTLKWKEDPPGSGRSRVDYTVQHANAVRADAVTLFAVDNSYNKPAGEPTSLGVFVRLVEATPGANHSSLVRVYEEAFQRGAQAVRGMIPSVLDGAIGLRVGTYQDAGRDLPILHVEFADYSVPVAGAGSGVYAIVRLALEVAAPSGGIVLVEEPEAHQHPAVIAQAAKVLLGAARRGVQIIVSTHSLELIDALVASADESDLKTLSVVRVVLDKGLLRSSRFTGAMVATARTSIDEDLR